MDPYRVYRTPSPPLVLCHKLRCRVPLAVACSFSSIPTCSTGKASDTRPDSSCDRALATSPSQSPTQPRPARSPPVNPYLVRTTFRGPFGFVSRGARASLLEQGLSGSRVPNGLATFARKSPQPLARPRIARAVSALGPSIIPRPRRIAHPSRRPLQRPIGGRRQSIRRSSAWRGTGQGGYAT